MRSYKLKQLLEIKNGRDYKHLNDGKIPVLGSGGIMCYVDNYIYDKESILLPRKGTLNNIQYINKPFWTVDTLYYSIVNKDLVEPYYLYHYLKKLDLSSLNSGTGVPSMTFGAYYGVEIKLPDLNTQKQIAKVLSDIDSKIELNNKINAELEAMAKLIYDYWFVQFDFPISETQAQEMNRPDLIGKPYKSSGGKMSYNPQLKREIPEGWEVESLVSLCNKIGDGIHGTPKYVDDSNYYFINGNNLKNGFIEIFPETKKVEKNEYEKHFIDLNESTILLSINGTLGNLALYTGENIMLGKSSAFINCKEDYRSYCYHYLKQPHMKKLFWNLATGSTIKNLSLESIKKLKLEIPKRSLIEKFNEMILPLDQKREFNFKENKNLIDLRNWLLPMLMNGQVKVN